MFRSRIPRALLNYQPNGKRSLNKLKRDIWTTFVGCDSSYGSITWQVDDDEHDHFVSKINQMFSKAMQNKLVLKIWEHHSRESIVGEEDNQLDVLAMVKLEAAQS